MFFLLTIATILVTSPIQVTGNLNRLRSLQFAPNSYIEFTPDWTPLTRAVSVCSWIKDTGSDSYRSFFSYYSNGEFNILANAFYIGIFSSWMDLRSKFTVSKGTWHHVCITWSIASRTHRYYVNGQLLGSQQTPAGRVLNTGGNAQVGRWIGTSSNHDFGGQMAYLNVYAKELSANEVAKMAQVGICSDIGTVDEHESSRVIKWEGIVKFSRSGTVTDVLLDQCFDTVDSKIEDFRGKLIESERKQNETAEELKSTREDLEETLAEKEKLEEELNVTLSELEKISINSNRTWDWDIFLSEKFLNKTFTTEHSQLLRTSWDDAAEQLVGFTITDELIQLLDYFDPVEDRPWLMLYSENYIDKVFTTEMAKRLTNIWDKISDKMVGVTMTKEVIDLLNHVTDKSNCGS